MERLNIISKILHTIIRLKNFIGMIAKAHYMGHDNMILFGQRILSAKRVDKICSVKHNDCFRISFAIFFYFHIYLVKSRRSGRFHAGQSGPRCKFPGGLLVLFRRWGVPRYSKSASGFWPSWAFHWQESNCIPVNSAVKEESSGLQA